MNKIEYYEKLRMNINDNIANISKLLRDINYKIKELEKSKQKTDALKEKFEIECYNYNYVDEMKDSRNRLAKDFSIIIKNAKKYVHSQPTQVDIYIDRLNNINDKLCKNLIEIKSIVKDDLSDIENLQINSIKKSIYGKYMIIKSEIDKDKIQNKFNKIQNRNPIMKIIDKFLCREDIVDQKKENLFETIKGINESMQNIINTEEPAREYKIIDILADMEIFVKENVKDSSYTSKLNEIVDLSNKIESTFSVDKQELKRVINEKHKSRLPVALDKKMSKSRKERLNIIQFLTKNGYNEVPVTVKNEPKMKLLINKLNKLSVDIEKQLNKKK